MMEFPDKGEYDAEDYTFPKNRYVDMARERTAERQRINHDVFPALDTLLESIVTDILNDMVDTSHATITIRDFREAAEKYANIHRYDELLTRTRKHLEAQATDLVHLADDIDEARPGTGIDDDTD